MTEEKKMREKEKKDKNVDETLKIIKKILDYNKDAYKFFQLASKVDKRKSKTKFEESIAETTKLRRQKLNIIAKKKENINDVLFSYDFDSSNADIMFKRLRDASDENNKNIVESINKKLTKLKNIVTNVPKDEVSKVEENEKIIDVVERILELNTEKGLKLLTPDQMLSRLPTILAQLKAGNNSEKLKNEIRQLLYSLYR